MGYFKVLSHLFLEGLWENHENLKVAGFHADIRTEDFPNTKQESYKLYHDVR